MLFNILQSLILTGEIGIGFVILVGVSELLLKAKNRIDKKVDWRDI